MHEHVTSRMVMGAGISQSADPDKAVSEVVEAAKKSLDNVAVDLAFLYISPHYKEHLDGILGRLARELSVKTLIGCTAAGIIGGSKELEQVQAMSFFAAQMPGVEVHPFSLHQSELETHTTTESLREFLEMPPDDSLSLLLFPDPFSLDIVTFLKSMDKAYPGTPVIGGLASGATEPGQNILILNDERFDQGAVGVALSGNLSVKTLVSQGCRPIGEPLVVTDAEGNIIRQIAGKPAVEVLQHTFSRASHRDQMLARKALFFGSAVNEYKQKLERGDFIIRNVISVDPEAGAITVGDYVEVGQTMQFHIRDADSAHEDLTLMCGKVKQDRSDHRPCGALVFSCNGRGRNMFPKQDHDVETLHEQLGLCPTAGFFCAGELGPIGGKNFLHGFTSSMAVFYPKSTEIS